MPQQAEGEGHGEENSQGRQLRNREAQELGKFQVIFLEYRCKGVVRDGLETSVREHHVKLWVLYHIHWIFFPEKSIGSNDYPSHSLC
jgi:hypothetical protein